MAAGMTKTTSTTLTGNKLLNNLKICMYHGDDDHLRNTFAGFDREGLIAPVPAGYKYLALVI